MKSLLMVSFMLGALVVSAQQFVTLRGKVTDGNKPVPFASLHLVDRGIGTSCNEAGEFVLRVPAAFANDTIVVSSIGYKSVRRIFDPVFQNIILESVPYQLEEITVRGETALELIKRVMIKLPEVYDTSGIHLTGFYREDTWLGDFQLNYNEGVLDIRRSFKIVEKKNTDQVRIIKGRKKEISFANTGKKAIIYHWLAGPSNGASNTVGDDLIKHHQGKLSVFNPKNFRYYNYSYGGYFDDGDRVLTIVNITPKRKSKKGIMNMKAFIDEQSPAIVRYEFTLTPEGADYVQRQDRNAGSSIASLLYGVKLDYHHFKIAVSYQWYEGKWYLSSVHRHFEILVNSRSRGWENELWRSDMNLKITSVDLKNKMPITDGNIADKKDRFSSFITDDEDEAFWENFNVIKPVVPDSLMRPITNDSVSWKTGMIEKGKELLYHNNKIKFDRSDSLRGMLTPLRTCYDVSFYHLDVEVNMEEKSIVGNNKMRFKVIDPFQRMQVDLYRSMSIERILHRGRELNFTREEDAVFINFPERLHSGDEEIIIYYKGIPDVPDWNVPMKGGVLWDKDENGNPWAQVVCQGSGASLWWPNKDHLSDEPDSMKIWITIPSIYKEVSNGRLIRTVDLPGNRTRYEWEVSYPINNYNVTFNIGKYVHLQDSLITDDTLILNYYVMDYHRESAEKFLSLIKPMLRCFEKYFGKYPFPRDGFSVVESIYPMEHQSGVCVGKLTDQILDASHNPLLWHEAAHEWWGNAVSCTDMADMWFHEAFATYAESLVIEEMFGKDAAKDFLLDQREGVINHYPIKGVPNVNHIFYDINDMYGKGSLVLHTLRNVIDNDSLWFALLYNIPNHFRYKMITSKELEDYISKFTGKKLDAFFLQYLERTDIPQLEYRLIEKQNNLEVHYRWKSSVTSFDMPAKVMSATDRYEFIYPTSQWKYTTLPGVSADGFEVDEENFLIRTIEVE